MLRKLEKYEIEEEIGHGGMATVYRAHDTVLKRKVALKVMHPHLRGAEEARRRFQREAESVARLRHPRVLEIYDFSGEGSEEAYIAAELLTGPTLKHWREKNRDVPAEIAACIAIEITKALGCAHEAGIIHRDVKPENVLLHEARTLKLTDFGIADMVDSASMTATGQILGSPGHMAPEQIEGRDSDPRTDLFSLGTVLYYLATGRLPFTGRNPHQILKRIVDGEFADPLRINPTIGGRMRAIIIKSLEIDPERRYQDAVEFREELEAFIAEVGIDDAPAMLERFLQDPERVSGEVVGETIPHLIESGSRASDTGDVPTALDYYNRVLALDDGNARVLKLIEKVGIDRRRRRLILYSGAMAVFGIVTLGGAYAVSQMPPSPTTHVENGGPTIENEDASIAAEPDAAIAEVAVEPDAGSTEVAVVVDAGSTRVIAPRPVAVVRVSVRSSFGNMTVQIDGQGAPQGIRGFPPVMLSPGFHTFVMLPGAEAIAFSERTEHTIRIPGGSAEYEVVLQGPDYRDAGILVRSTAGAQVEIGSGSTVIRGPASELLHVPMTSRHQTFRVRVTLDGRQAEDRVSLAAGENARADISLPEAPIPPREEEEEE